MQDNQKNELIQHNRQYTGVNFHKATVAGKGIEDGDQDFLLWHHTPYRGEKCKKTATKVQCSSIKTLKLHFSFLINHDDNA